MLKLGPDARARKGKMVPELRELRHERQLAIADARQWLDRDAMGITPQTDPREVIEALISAFTPRIEDERSLAILEVLRDLGPLGPLSVNRLRRELAARGMSGGKSDVSARLQELEKSGLVVRVPGGRGSRDGRWMTVWRGY